MRKKVEKLLASLAEVEEKLGWQEVLQDQKQYRTLTQRHAYLVDVRNCWEALEKSRKQHAENKELLESEKDPDFVQMIADEIERLDAKIKRHTRELEQLLVPPDPTDNHNTILEIRAGTGGEEAALFVADCVRMYQLFAQKKRWRVEALTCSPSELGGYKEYVMVISGPNAYRLLRHEAGTHRVQRIPETEAQGRVHTSAVTVAALIEPEKEDEVGVDEKELRIDTFRSSGAGGQHVNTTDSAVRITHLPTGIVVSCQDERSQHKNKARAMRVLQAKLMEERERKARTEQASTRASQVGSGDRSERVRTYNFPQNRVTDHRIGMTRHNLDQVMQGDLDEISTALVADLHQKKLET